MSVDERLKIALARNALTVNPDVEAVLERTVVRQRRDRRIRWTAATAGLVAAACAAVVVLTGGGGDNAAPALPATSPSANPQASLVGGRYVGQVAGPTSSDTAGTWTLEFRSGGVLTVAAPRRVTRVLTGVHYSFDGDGIETDLFGQDLCAGLSMGRYEVSRTGGGLTLRPVGDPCPERVAVLAVTTWVATAPVAVTEGAWTREVTTAEIARRGLTLSPAQVRDNFLTDGTVRLRLETRGARWTLQVEDDEGELIVGDLGESAYDADGRWVQHSDRTGGAAVLVWTTDGDTLTTAGPASLADDERLFLEGTWERER